MQRWDYRGPMFTCTGASAATQEPCSFTTADREAAFTHFERFDHDVVRDPGSADTDLCFCGHTLLVHNERPDNTACMTRSCECLDFDLAETQPLPCWCGGEDGEHNDEVHAAEGRW